ncbi:AI-2E family transporter [Desulfosarcina alkanivorans]|uniref:AI-2E family transporter n=1 Tax=Desulfosarcina alkanivorans TaxID=571177 RepID=A0A5K7YMB8_9BACT|nr:AI-2E family transporter [Desulfosarcina alkanivorans]BBO69390.1 AI-2E family transporter [Desulfosarcina alkanivorans]
MFELFRTWKDRHFSDPQRVILGVMLLAGAGLIYFLGSLLAPVLISIIIAYLLDGMVSLFQRSRLPRLAAVSIVFTVFMVAMVVMTLWLIPLTVKQISQLVQQLPGMLTTIQYRLLELPTNYPELISENQIREIIAFLNTGISTLGKRVLTLSLASVMGLIHLVVYLVLVPFMVFFLLKDKEMILDWGRRFLPDNMDLTESVWQEANVQVTNYIRGKGWELLIIWGVSYAVFRAMGLQFSLLISLFVGLSVIIPYIGVTVMGFVMALVAFIQWGWSSQFASAMVAYMVIQILDGNLLAPLLLSGVVNLHPVAIVVAVLLFGGLWGLWGLFFAIPLATLVNAVIKAWFMRVEQRSETPS